MENRKASPFAERIKQSGVQFSLGSILLITVIGAGVSSLIYYAAHIPNLRRDVAAMFGQTAEASPPDVSRVPHLTFILFCYAGPLLLTGLFGTYFNVLKFLRNRNLLEVKGDEPEEEAWDANITQREAMPEKDTTFRIAKP